MFLSFVKVFFIFLLLLGILLALIHYKYNLKISRKLKKINSIIYLLYNVALIGLCIFVTAESNNYANKGIINYYFHNVFLTFKKSAYLFIILYKYIV